MDTVKHKTASQLNAGKSRATAQLDEIAHNIRRSTERLRAERHEAVAALLERAGDRLERLSAQLRDHDVEELLRAIEAFGRRRPALFLGTSFAAGLMLARFAKASSEAADSSRGGRVLPSFNRPGSGEAGWQGRQ
ncbi:MAG TPA: hypothetical protein VNK41_10490 [Vicinamibacterales bacterium]|nr:hypothetical protein [Vicinamibacterales bacterium]